MISHAQTKTLSSREKVPLRWSPMSFGTQFLRQAAGKPQIPQGFVAVATNNEHLTVDDRYFNRCAELAVVGKFTSQLLFQFYAKRRSLFIKSSHPLTNCGRYF